MSETDSAAGQSPQRIYDVLDREATVAVQSKDSKLLITATLTRPSDSTAELKALLALNDSILRETEMSPKGEEIKYNDVPAMAKHFFDLQPRVTVKRTDDDSEPVALNADQVNQLSENNRAKLVGKLYQSKFVVLQNGGDSGFAYLFEPTKGDDDQSFTTVRQFIGDPVNPSFVIDHYTRRPGKERRSSYETRCRRTFTDRKGDMPKRRVVVDLRPGIELFESHFVSARGPFLQGTQYGVKIGENVYTVLDENVAQDFAEGDRAPFINGFLPLWKADFADALVSSFDTDLQD